MPSMNRERSHITLLGVRIDDVSMAETLAHIEALIQAGTPHQIVTINPEFVMAAQQNAAFAAVLRTAALAVPDGVGLKLAARLAGQRLHGWVAGVDLCEQLAAASQSHGWRLFLLGAAPCVADATATVLRQRFPGVVLGGTYAGSPRPEDEATIQALIAAAQPDVLLVAYGAPAQDLWIARNQSGLRVPVAIGVGGSFDYLSGRVLRAPRWIRQLGLEWLFRLLRQPRRWKRIWTAVVIFPMAVLWDRWRSR